MAYYKIHKFKEGGTLLYREDKTVNAVDVAIYITTGAAADGDKPGLTHFLEHMLFCDTTNRKESEIDKKSIELHNRQNATTYHNAVGLDFCAPTRTLEESFKHNADILLNSTFPEDKIKREKEVVISEMLMVGGYGGMTESLIANCYGDDLGILDSLVGTEESIRSITRQDLLDYRAKYFNRNNLVISMVGNVSYSDAKALCKKYIVSKIAPMGPMFIPEVQNSYLRRDFNFLYYHNRYARSSVLQFAFPFVGKQNYKNALLSTFINKILYTRIHNDLRQKQALMYTSHAYDMQFSNDGLKIIEIETANEKSNAVMRGVASLIGKMVKEGVTEEEFLSVKQDYLDAANFGGSNYVVGKASDLYHSYINNNRVYTDKERNDIFHTVTVEDLNEYMLKIFDTEKVIVNYDGNRTKEQLYNADQIQALFLLNRFTREQLSEMGYETPDMGCPGEFVEFNKKYPWGFNTKQLLIEHFEQKKRGRKKKQQEPAKPKTFEEMPKEKRDAIKAYLKECGLDLDNIEVEFVTQEELDKRQQEANKNAEEENEFQIVQ